MPKIPDEVLVFFFSKLVSIKKFMLLKDYYNEDDEIGKTETWEWRFKINENRTTIPNVL